MKKNNNDNNNDDDDDDDDERERESMCVYGVREREKQGKWKKERVKYLVKPVI